MHIHIINPLKSIFTIAYSIELNIPTDSNASVKMVGPTKTEIIFPRDGYMRLGQFKFNNKQEIEAYLCGVFMADNEK